MNINRNYQALEDDYLFAEIASRVGTYQQSHPEADIIRLGIGDVTRPLCPAVVGAMAEAVAEMGRPDTFRGYGPYEGYDFLRQAIVDYYKGYGVTLGMDEVFVGDGAKSDLALVLDLFAADNRVLVPDPVYPVYVDTNRMAGREIRFMEGRADNSFLPMPDEAPSADIIYLCSPNNPTGAVYSRDQLQAWVDHANQSGAVILFDAAYEAFVRDPALPRSIFELPGAETCAMEFCSLSKTAGFTGTRCGYTVIPRALAREGVSLGRMWLRHQSTKFNGVPYVIQRGAAAVFSPEGQRQCRESVDYYMQNAAIIGAALKNLGIPFSGGENSPYLWLRCPDGMDSWAYFDLLLEAAHVVGTPGAGFGRGGEGHFRLTAFGDRGRTEEAVRRLAAVRA